MHSRLYQLKLNHQNRIYQVDQQYVLVNKYLLKQVEKLKAQIDVREPGSEADRLTSATYFLHIFSQFFGKVEHLLCSFFHICFVAMSFMCSRSYRSARGRQVE